ncbi:hypothetical protein CASFOL_027903 [Castilleja foliolosa]|uniref:Serine/threonine-protein phosphatase 2A 55 kDa regulatory subunit B n=1 Tax=Castilleja foliolosa TaxID=1961234 RepID=A0ABD3CH29_9LAMI
MSVSFSSGTSVSSPADLEWRFSQVFGDKLPGEDVQNVDVISAIEFDKNGDHMAVGDRGGRLVIFQSDCGKDDLDEFTSQHELEQLDSVVSRHPKFQYKTEFQSHEPEFDSLKSIEIEEKINKIKWCATPNGSLSLLSANDKTIKLWRVKDHEVSRAKEMDIGQSVSSENSLLSENSFINGQQSRSDAQSLEWTENTVNGVSSGHDKRACSEDATCAKCRSVYAHAHDFNVNSISVNSVITAAEFHPIHCNLLAYSSSRGYIRLVDMRQSALCDHSARILKDEESNGSKSFFTEIIASITDMKFAYDGRHILSRDYMNLKLWDMHMDASPVATYKIHDNLRPKLCDLYNSDAIFDKFECCIAKGRLSFATGSYSNHLRVFNYGSGNDGVTVEANQNPNRKPEVQTTSRARRSSLSNLARGFYRPGPNNHDATSNEYSYDFNSKLLHMAWHPTTNMIACAAGNSLFMYHA